MSPSLTRSEARFVAFAARALPRAFGLGLPEPVLAEHYCRAVQAIGARLVLACARERLVAHVHSLDMALETCSIQVPLRRRRAFGLHLVDESACRLPQLSALLDLLLPDRPAMVRARLLVELDDSAWNLALARAARDLREIALAHNSWLAPRDPENFVCDGHPWHPMTKARLGLRPWEVLRYGPELCAQAAVYAVDLARAHAQLAPSGPSASASSLYEELARELFPAPAPGFIRLPVHALQLRRLPRLLGALWGDIVRPTNCRPLAARALLSLRTVALAAPALHLKLSADIHTTSARRLVSPASVHNGPRLSALLGRIQAVDPDAARGLRIQPDLAAAGLHPRHGALAGQLGVILRPDPTAISHDFSDMPTNTCPKSNIEKKIIVCAALGERRPGGDLLLRELSADYPGDLSRRLRGFFGDYLELLVPPLLRLLTAHGVALEAHLQNTSLVHARRPRGFLIRDLGGVRVHRARLLAAGHALDLAPGSFTITRELAEAQGKLMHTLVHAHLAALLGWIDDAGGPDPAALWPEVRQIFQRHLDRWAAAPQHARACAEDRAFFFADTCRSKALLAMRIDERVSDYAYTEVANALAGGYPPSA